MAVIRLDKVQSVYHGNLESVKLAADATNGVFVKLNGLVAGEREVKNGVAVADVTKDTVLLLSAPEVMYDPRKKGLKDFVIEAGVATRAYHLSVGDIITLTEDLFVGTPVVGEYAAPANGDFKLHAAADLTAGSRVAFEVIEKTVLGAEATTAYAIQVITV